MPEALKDGTVTEAAITRAAGRVLYEIVHFGYLDGQSKHEVTEQAIEANAKIIEKTGEDAAVLLKNEGGVLPLKAADLDSVVLIGPTAGQVDSIGINGERSVGLPERQVGPLRRAEEDLRQLQHRLCRGRRHDRNAPFRPALLSHDGKPGLDRTGDGQRQIDAQLNFTVKGGNALPPNSTVTWKGTLTVAACRQLLDLSAGDGHQRCHLRSMASVWRAPAHSRAACTATFCRPTRTTSFPPPTASTTCAAPSNSPPVRTRSKSRPRPTPRNAPVQVRLNWYTPEQRKADHEAAIAAAKNAKVAVVFRLDAPAIRSSACPASRTSSSKKSPPSIPTPSSSSTPASPLRCPGSTRSRQSSKCGGPATRAAGRRPTCFSARPAQPAACRSPGAKRLDDYPATDPKYPERSKKGVDKKTTYSEGVNVGYRWFDKENIEPLFAFGHGLSYTTFDYSGLKVARRPRTAVSTSKSTSRTPAAWIPTKCRRSISARPARSPTACSSRSARWLPSIAFICAGGRIEERHSARRRRASLQYWSTKDGKWVTATGKRTVSVGGSSRNLRLNQTID